MRAKRIKVYVNRPNGRKVGWTWPPLWFGQLSKNAHFGGFGVMIGPLWVKVMWQ